MKTERIDGKEVKQLLRSAFLSLFEMVVAIWTDPVLRSLKRAIDGFGTSEDDGTVV